VLRAAKGMIEITGATDDAGAAFALTSDPTANAAPKIPAQASFQIIFILSSDDEIPRPNYSQFRSELGPRLNNIFRLCQKLFGKQHKKKSA
jgi:hypothetical protein